MPTESGKCVLIIEGQKFDGISFAMEWDGGPQAFGFLSEARQARSVHLELEDGTIVLVTMLEDSPAGMALVVIDPKQLPPRSI
jgi:hypothetical protein